MRRRDFARTVARGAAGLAASTVLPAQFSCSRQTDAISEEPLDAVGLQLYTVRELMDANVRDTLVEVARIGYTEVEFAGYFGQSATTLRDLLDGLGVTAPATHLSIDDLRDDLDGVLSYAQMIGHKYLIVPSLDQSVRTPSGFRRIADEFNDIGARVRDAGLTLGYHNHVFEFEEVDGQIGYDILLENCPADLVVMEIDLFWIAMAGRDPLEYFAKYPDRFRLCHVKDRDPNGNMVDVGKGSLDFKSLIAAGRAAGMQHFFVEHDEPNDALSSVTASFDHLSKLTF